MPARRLCSKDARKSGSKWAKGSHGLYSTAPSTTIITVTHTRVAAARAPDTHRSSASRDRGSYDASARKTCCFSTGLYEEMMHHFKALPALSGTH